MFRGEPVTDGDDSDTVLRKVIEQREIHPSRKLVVGK